MTAQKYLVMYQSSFQTAGIGGPSAGMMFSLSIYTQVADPDLVRDAISQGQGPLTMMGLSEISVEWIKKS